MNAFTGQTRRARHAVASLLLSVLGLLMLIAAAGYGLDQISKLRGQIDGQENDLSVLKGQAEALQRKVTTIRDGSIQELIEGEFIKARAIGMRTRPVVGETRKHFNYVVWLDIPYARKVDIQEVKYEFRHSSIIDKEQYSSEASNGFAVGYFGWGALNLVPITIVPKDASAEKGTIGFRMNDPDEIKYIPFREAVN